MTLFQKIISVTFASIVLFISIVFMLTLGGILPPDLGSNIMENIVEGDFLSKILFALFAILAIFSVREIAFGEKVSKEGKEGLILENDSGKLIISNIKIIAIILPNFIYQKYLIDHSFVISFLFLYKNYHFLFLFLYLPQY